MPVRNDRNQEPIITGPSCESPIEIDIEHRLRKYLAGDVEVERQAPVDTPWGSFRIDFVLRKNGVRVGLECDGAEFHDEYRDEWRDAIVLGTESLEEVLRLAGRDVVYRADDCLYLLAELHPAFFTPRAKDVLSRLASQDAHRAAFRAGTVQYFSVERADDEEGTPLAQHIVQIGWRSRVRAKQQYWRKLYAAAVDIGPCPLDELIEKDTARWSTKF